MTPVDAERSKVCVVERLEARVKGGEHPLRLERVRIAPRGAGEAVSAQMV